MPDDTTTVPPDHRVVVVAPTPKPGFGQLSCGVWVLNFGDPSFLDEGFRVAAKFVGETGEPCSICTPGSGQRAAI